MQLHWQVAKVPSTHRCLLATKSYE